MSAQPSETAPLDLTQPVSSQQYLKEMFESLQIVKLQNPSTFYKVKTKMQKDVYKAERKSDGKMFAMKSIAANSLNDHEIQKLRNHGWDGKME